MTGPDWAARLRGRTVAVIGDVMLDEFVIGRVDRISPEAPVPIVRFERREYRLGGAANVAHNVVALGGHATLVGLIGDDATGVALRGELKSRGLSDASLVTDRTRATTKKTRIVTTRNQQVARVDHEQDDAVSSETLAALCASAIASARSADAIILSDYRKGAVAPEVIAAVVGVARATGRPLLIDPKIADAARYRGATLLTPNHHEAELMTGISIRTRDDARRAAREIHARAEASVLITWGEHGMWLFDASLMPQEDAEIPAAAREVADVTGAGDTVIATLALAMAAAIPLKDAARLATLAAGIVVGRFGPATVSVEELMEAWRLEGLKPNSDLT